MSKKQIRIMAGKVPATVKELLVDEGCTVLEAMKIAAEKCKFNFTTKVFIENGKEMLDIPYVNGEELCRREKVTGGTMIKEVFWDRPLKEADVVLIVPKIKGNEQA